MKRGEVRWYKFKSPDKKRPVLIITRDSVLEYLSKVTIAPITSTIRDIPSEVLLTREDGMRKDCAINCDHIQTISKDKRTQVSKAIWFALNIFGTDDNEIHWKKITIENLDEFQNEFRSIIYTVTGLSKDGWDEYWRKLCEFRNNYVAHVVLEYNEPVPRMDHALTVARVYDEWIRKELNVVCIQEDLKPIRKYHRIS